MPKYDNFTEPGVGSLVRKNGFCSSARASEPSRNPSLKVGTGLSTCSSDAQSGQCPVLLLAEIPTI